MLPVQVLSGSYQSLPAPSAELQQLRISADLNTLNAKFLALLTLGAVALAEHAALLQTSSRPPLRTSSLSKPITVGSGQTFIPPEPYTRYDRGFCGCNGQSEGGDSDAVFLLQDGATLSRVVIGPNQSEGVHCLGTYWTNQKGSGVSDSAYMQAPARLNHVYFEDVCEDAITLKQKSGTSRINYGGAKHADDQDIIDLPVVQHNRGGTVIINSILANYRSCGNCDTMHKRDVPINDVWAVDGSELNYGDTAKIRTTRVEDVNTICQRETMTVTSPPKAGSGPDSKYCLYRDSDIDD